MKELHKLHRLHELYHPKALAEALRSARYYNDRVPGLGAEFFDAVDLDFCRPQVALSGLRVDIQQENPVSISGPPQPFQQLTMDTAKAAVAEDDYDLSPLRAFRDVGHDGIHVGQVGGFFALGFQVLH